MDVALPVPATTGSTTCSCAAVTSGLGNGVTTELTFDANTQWLTRAQTISPNRDVQEPERCVQGDPGPLGTRTTASATRRRTATTSRRRCPTYSAGRRSETYTYDPYERVVGATGEFQLSPDKLQHYSLTLEVRRTRQRHVQEPGRPDPQRQEGADPDQDHLRVQPHLQRGQAAPEPPRRGPTATRTTPTATCWASRTARTAGSARSPGTPATGCARSPTAPIEHRLHLRRQWPTRDRARSRRRDGDHQPVGDRAQRQLRCARTCGPATSGIGDAARTRAATRS